MIKININNNLFSFDYKVRSNSVQIRVNWNNIVIGAYLVVEEVKENKTPKFTVFYKDTPYSNSKKKDFRYSDKDIITGRSIDRSLRPFLKNTQNDITLNVILFQNSKHEDVLFPAIIASIIAVYLSGGEVETLYASKEDNLIIAINQLGVVMMEGFFNGIDYKNIINVLNNAYKNMEDFWKSLKKENLKISPFITYNLHKKQSEETANIVEHILTTKKRLDNRKFTEIRPINVDMSPLNAPSVIFSRGVTEVMTVLNYHQGEKQECQFSYNFHPFSVEESGDTIGMSRREKGHSYLINNSLYGLVKNIPLSFKFYGEVLGCNGSSSMASVCGGSICLHRLFGTSLISGIAVGLIQHKKKQAILVDLMSSEDAISHCDFKITNNKDGKIFSIFMDSNLEPISIQNIENLFKEGIKANISIIKLIEKALQSDKNNVKFCDTLYIKKEKIPYLIGNGGNNIKEIMQLTSSFIKVFDNGLVLINSKNKKNLSVVNNIISSYNTLVHNSSVTCIIKSKTFNKDMWNINMGLFTFPMKKFKLEEKSIVTGIVKIDNKTIILEKIKKVKIV